MSCGLKGSTTGSDDIPFGKRESENCGGGESARYMDGHPPSMKKSKRKTVPLEQGPREINRGETRISMQLQRPNLLG